MAKGLFGRLVLPIVRGQKKSVRESTIQPSSVATMATVSTSEESFDARWTSIAFSTTDPIGNDLEAIVTWGARHVVL